MYASCRPGAALSRARSAAGGRRWTCMPAGGPFCLAARADMACCIVSGPLPLFIYHTQSGASEPPRSLCRVLRAVAQRGPDAAAGGLWGHAHRRGRGHDHGHVRRTARLSHMKDKYAHCVELSLRVPAPRRVCMFPLHCLRGQGSGPAACSCRRHLHGSVDATACM